jgi:hypothetical protein
MDAAGVTSTSWGGLPSMTMAGTSASTLHNAGVLVLEATDVAAHISELYQNAEKVGI